MILNKRILLAKRPMGFPSADDFEVNLQPLQPLSDGEILVKNHYLSLDPYMRGQMDGIDSYIKGLHIGDVMAGHTVGQVVSSKHVDFKDGQYVWGPGNWQEFAVLRGPPLRIIDPQVAPLPAWLGPLGLPGWTAYLGLAACSPAAGETIVISSAAGAVGGLVGQLARAKGMHVVGIAGGAKKCDMAINEYGFHHCVDYKVSDFVERMAKACPDGVDVDFENVGGDVLSTLWPLLNDHSRVLICGLMAHYNTAISPGLDLTKLLKARICIKGFIISDHFAMIPEAIRFMFEQVHSGRIRYKTDIAEGLDNAPSAFIAMLKGQNVGKAVVQL